MFDGILALWEEIDPVARKTGSRIHECSAVGPEATHIEAGPIHSATRRRHWRDLLHFLARITIGASVAERCADTHHRNQKCRFSHHARPMVSSLLDVKRGRAINASSKPAF